MCPPSELDTAFNSTTSTSIPSDANIPQSPLCSAAYAHASSALHRAILNHSMRVYLYASALAASSSAPSPYAPNAPKHALLFTACLFHDIGTAQQYNGPQRFEVEGGDAAVAFLTRFDVAERDKHDVWTAIACHTSPGVAERIGELARLVRAAVLADFGRGEEGLMRLKEGLEGVYVREGIEKVLGDAVVEQVQGRAGKVPMVSWPGVMWRAAVAEPEWEGVNKAFG